MKSISILSLVAIIVLIISSITFTSNGIPGIDTRTAEAGHLSKRLESKHSPSPHSQATSQGGDSEAQEKCIEMLHKGDHEGAQKCIAELQGDDSTGPQAPATQTQPAAQPAAAPAPATVSSAASGTQGELFDAREKCAEMLRSGDHAGARECIRQLRN